MLLPKLDVKVDYTTKTIHIKDITGFLPDIESGFSKTNSDIQNQVYALKDMVMVLFVYTRDYANTLNVYFKSEVIRYSEEQINNVSTYSELAYSTDYNFENDSLYHVKLLAVPKKGLLLDSESKIEYDEVNNIFIKDGLEYNILDVLIKDSEELNLLRCAINDKPEILIIPSLQTYIISLLQEIAMYVPNNFNVSVFDNNVRRLIEKSSVAKVYKELAELYFDNNNFEMCYNTIDQANRIIQLYDKLKRY